MFAGAAREAVFSSEKIAQRVNDEFVPVALKAAMINNPPPGVEGELYAEISRSKPAPQGICVANSSGKALAWALSFDDDASIPKFLDYAVQRYKESPDAAEPVVTERFMKFPSRKLADITDTKRTLTIPERHANGDRCPAQPALQRGTLVGRIIGRPLDKDGRPIEKTARQEDYMESRFEIPVSLQKRFANALASTAEGESFPVPKELARLLVSSAYLGQLDVNPLGGRQTGGLTDRETIDFQAERLRGDKGPVTVRITGKSDVSGGPAEAGVRTDGRRWEHHVQLAWEGYIDVDGDRMTGVVLTAQGAERLRWGNQRGMFGGEPDVAHLMAGHPIDLDCEVRYGLLAQPIPDAEAAKGNDRTTPNNDDAKQGLSMQQRLTHLREAVKHLQAAGVHEIADHLARQIERMEKALSQEQNKKEK